MIHGLRRRFERLLAGIGLRPRVAALVLVSVLPLVGLLVAGSIDQRSEVIAQVKSEAFDLARLGAEREAGALAAVAGTLRDLLVDPSPLSDSPALCRQRLLAFREENKGILNLALIGSDGRELCSSAQARGASFRDRAWFKAALLPHAGLIVSRFIRRGPLGAQPMIVLALAAPAQRRGQRPIVAAATLNPQSLPDLANLHPPWSGAAAMLIDLGDLRIIPHYPKKRRWLMAPLAHFTLLQGQLRNIPGSFAVPIGLDGFPRIGTYVPLPLRGAERLAVAVSFPTAVILTAADRALAIDLILSLLVLAAALAAAWSLSEVSLLSAVHILSKAATQFGAGALTTRARLPPWISPELRALARAMNEMARSLIRRERSLLAAQAAITSSEAGLRLIAEHSSDVIIRFDTNMRRLYVSPACREVLGRTPEEMLARTICDDMLPEDLPRILKLIERGRRDRRQARFTYRLRRADGAVIWIESTTQWLPDDSGFAFLRDVSRRKEAEAELAKVNRQLEALALQDALTGLGNRRHFDETLEREFRRAARAANPLALALMDLDHFKAFNDFYGHQAGDECLRSVARAITSCLRLPGDLAMRYGGEELAVIAPETDISGALRLAERIAEAVRALKISHKGNESGIVTLSIGIASMVPGREADTPSPLLCSADRALYQAKADGRNLIRVATEAYAAAAHTDLLFLS